MLIEEIQCHRCIFSSVEASLHCHHQLTFSVGDICTPVITKVNIHMTSTSQYNMLLRFERKYFAIYEHDMFTVNIYFFIRISRVLCFFKHFLWFKLYKSDQFQFFIWVFFQSGNDSNVNLYYTIRFPLLYFSNVIYVFFIFVIKSCIELVCVASLLSTQQ